METLRYLAKYLITVLISLLIFSILWFASSSSVLAAVDFTVYDDSLFIVVGTLLFVIVGILFYCSIKEMFDL
jgi:hypothetical protein